MIKVDVGNRIRELRKNKNYTQEKLAKLCELDRTYINSIEKGKRNISLVNLEIIADNLGVSLYEFFSYLKK